MNLSLVGAWADVMAGIMLAMVSYVATNVDNLFLMTASAARVEDRRAVVLGFLLSSLIVMGLSVAFVAASAMFSPRALGMLGFIPIFIGIRILLNRRRDQEDATLPAIRALPVGLALLANSTDTVATFGPLLAESEPAALFAMLVGYVLMAGFWIVLALRLSTRIARMEMAGRVARWATPIVMIIIGIYILLDTPTDTLVSIS